MDRPREGMLAVLVEDFFRDSHRRRIAVETPQGTVLPRQYSRMSGHPVGSRRPASTPQP